MDQYQLTHLPGLPYMRANCMSECRRVHMMKFCNCSVGFQFPIGINFDVDFSKPIFLILIFLLNC